MSSKDSGPVKEVEVKAEPETEAELQTESDKKLAVASAGGASTLIALQVGSRALTFLVNQVLLRYLSPELLAVSTQLEVYSISVLFFARESLRVAVQRQTDSVQKRPGSHSGGRREGKSPQNTDHVDANTPAGKSQTLVNLSYISIALGTALALIFASIYLQFTYDPVTLSIPYFALALQVYGAAAVLELSSEPYFVIVQQKSEFKIRARAEWAATFLRCLATTGSAVWASRKGIEFGVLPFAIGQATYAASLISVYFLSTFGLDTKNGFSFSPKEIRSKDATYVFGLFSRHLLSLVYSLYAQSIFKQILTQGDTLIIAALTTKHTQGIYALAANYGGLIARLILQPVEESSRNYFGKLLASKESRPSREVVNSARDTLAAILRAYVHFGIGIAIVGPRLAPKLLRLVVGEAWAESGAGEVLATYCYFVPLLAINGLTEAFVSSVATKSEVDSQTKWMFVFSAGFAAAAYYFLAFAQLGAQGLVWANVINMILRIIWSSRFISRYLKRNGTSFIKVTLRPEPATIATAVGLNMLFQSFEFTQFDGSNRDIIISGSMVAGFLLIVIFIEWDFIYNRYLIFNGLPPLPPRQKEDEYY